MNRCIPTLVGVMVLLALAGRPAAAAAQASEPTSRALPDPPPVEVAPPAMLAGAGLHGAMPAEKLVVLDRAVARAVLVDPRSRQVLAHVPTGPEPNEVAISADGRRAYVANYGSSVAPPLWVENPYEAVPLPRTSGSVTVVDLETAAVLRTLYPFRAAGGEVLPVTYSHLHGIQVGPTGSRLFLTAEADSGVLELDARTGEVLMLWKTGAAMSHTVVTSRDARRLFIANRGSDWISVIDRLTVTARRVPTGPMPEGLALAPSGAEVWVANRGDHTITVVDARNYRPLARFPSGGQDPVRLAFRPQGAEVWVAHAGSHELVVFDASSRKRLATLELGVAPFGLVFSPDGRELYVTAPEAGRVVVLDARWRHTLDSFETDGAPDGLAWSRPSRGAAAGQ